MDKIIHSTFDFFTHALPGFVIVIAFMTLDPNITSSQQCLSKANEIDTGGGVMLLLIGYIIGFAINPLGRWLYKTVGFKIWPKKIHENIDDFISNKFILIREFSPNNFRYVETWNMYCAMAHNLAIASVALFLCGVFKLLTQGHGDTYLWGGLVAISAVFFIIFLHRAVVFSIWSADDLNAAYKELKLKERAAKLDQVPTSADEDNDL